MGAGDVARERLEESGGPIVLTGWRNAVFHHLAVDPAILQPHVPFDLDLYGGRAYVSIVFFYQEPLRAAAGGVARRLLRGMRAERFCNLRTYVRAGEEGAVYFIREWISDPFTATLAPCVYGLPSMPAQIRYENDMTSGILFGQVAAGRDRLDVVARVEYDAPEEIATPGSLDEFLLERYLAVTDRGRLRSFRIWHANWRVQPVTVDLGADSLLRRVAPWSPSAGEARSHFSRGMGTVLIGRPHTLRHLPSAKPSQSPKAGRQT